MISAVPALAQSFQGDVRAVGFPASVATRFAVRDGQWFPILCELTLRGDTHFQGRLQCEQIDVDGDRVVFAETPVTLTAGGGLKRVWCYAVALRGTTSPSAAVDLVSDAGGRVLRLETPQFEFLSNDALLLLDISRNPVARLRALQGGDLQDDELAGGPGTFSRSIAVAAMPANELPDRWFGLEAVNVIVWDEPVLDDMNPQQLGALLTWVRNGGQLVVGVGAAWTNIQRHAELAALFPLRGPAETVTSRDLPNYLATLDREPAEPASFEQPVTLIDAQLADGALRTFWDKPGDRPPLSLIAMRNVGSGRIVAAAASLNELARPLRGMEEATRLLGQLLDLNPLGTELQKNIANQTSLLRTDFVPFNDLISPTEFRGIGAVFVVAALIFVSVYVAIAAPVSWAWLKRHRRTHLSWTVFAGFALLASVLSVGAVSLSRGVFGEVRSMSLVDLENGSATARATCWFGYRSPRRERVDFALLTEQPDGSLVDGDNYLRAVARGPAPVSHYSTPERYAAYPDRAELTNAPLRATVKQFEGFWQGTLTGTVRASLAVDGDGKITPQSWIENGLPDSIVGGYVLYVDPRGGALPRAAGATRPARGAYKNLTWVPPSVNVLAVELPEVKAGTQIRGIGRAVYEDFEKQLNQWENGTNPDPRHRPELPTLWDAQRNWVDPSFVARLPVWLDGIARAALVVSTRDLYYPGRDDLKTPASEVRCAGVTDRDVTHWLVRGEALLLLVSYEPGPARLSKDGEPLAARGGRCVYRVRVPLQYVR